MEDIVERLRYGANCPVSGDGDNDKLEAAEEIESIRAQLAEVTMERDELKTVPMKYRRMKFNAELQAENAKLQEQLLATQAKLLESELHAARLVEALTQYKGAYGRDGNMQLVADEALSTPINLDALHEDRARTLEKAGECFLYGIRSELMEMAAAQRAKKDSHQ